MTWIILFGLACLGVLGLSIATWREYGRSDAVIMSVVLCGAWLVSKLIAHHFDVLQLLAVNGDWDAAKRFYPAMDALAVAIAGCLFAERPEWWKVGLIGALVATLYVHFLYAVESPSRDFPPNDYVFIVNAGFGLKILFASWPGGRIVADRCRRRWFADRALGPGVVSIAVRQAATR